MIYCLNCGKGIPDQSKFCTFCGTAIKIADITQPANSTPHVEKPDVNTPVSHQPYTPPVAPQHTAPPQQFVSHTPAAQNVNPGYVQPTQQYGHAHTTANISKNEFYKNIGFWGAVLTLVGFFLPYESVTGASLYYLVTEYPEYAVYLYLIFPVSAAIIILQAFTGILPRFLVGVFKILPLALLGFLLLGTYNNDKYNFSNTDLQTILGYIGVGLYMIVIGSILMLFFRTTKQNAGTIK